MEIKLIFSSENVFCPITIKYGYREDRIEIAKNVVWVINNALNSIENAYPVNSVRRIEMQQLADNLFSQVKSQLTQDEIELLKLE